MDCREFKEKHVAFVDDTLAGVELVGMQLHVIECPRCAKHDTDIRRALFLVRNLPIIEPSTDFQARLKARLDASLIVPLATAGVRGRAAAAATLAAAAMLGYIALTLYKVETPRDVVMAPVVASTPESDIAPISIPSASIVASAPAGLAIWPSAVFAEQAPIHFAHARLASASPAR
jgi:hypothetical protein